MTVGVVSKRVAKRTCGECEAELEKDEPCSEHPDANVKKSLVVVRKAEGDDTDDLDAALEEEDADEDDDEEEEEDDSEEEDEEEDGDEDEDDEDEEDDEEETPADADLKKSDVPVMTVEALGIATQFAEEIAKVFATKGDKSAAYEDVMTEFNNVMDAAADRWRSGTTVSKSSSKSMRAKQLAIISNKVKSVIAKAEGKEMPKKPARPSSLDGLQLPDDVAAYIKELEGGEVSKSDDIYKGLHPEVAERLKKADDLVEKSIQKDWDDVAAQYKHVPGDKSELSKALRTAFETSPEAFNTLKKSLDAAEYNLSQSDIFKSHGSRGGGEPSDEISKRDAAAKELVSKGDFPTVEQALLHLMNQEGGKFYRPTVQAQ